MNRANDNFHAAHAPNPERRAASRKRTLYSGKIVFNKQSSVFNCIVRNISEAGACLEVESPLGIPNEFELQVEGVGIKAEYRVIWRQGKRIGVSRREASLPR